MSTRSSRPRSATRRRASSACGSDSVIPVTCTPCCAAAWMREASPAAADVEHALAGLQRELGADQLELLLLRLLERRRAAREQRAAVRHRRARGTARRTRPAGRSGGARRARRARGCGGARWGAAPPPAAAAGSRRPAGPRRREQQPRPRARGRAAAAASGRASRARRRDRRPPARPRRRRGPIPSCPGARSTCATAAGERTWNVGPAAVGRGQPRAVPQRDRERALGERPLELADQRSCTRERHARMVRLRG